MEWLQCVKNEFFFVFMKIQPCKKEEKEEK